MTALSFPPNQRSSGKRAFVDQVESSLPALRRRVRCVADGAEGAEGADEAEARGDAENRGDETSGSPGG